MTTQLFSPPTVGVETRPDGSVLMSSTQRLMPYATSVVRAFREGSRAHPERTLVAERDVGGDQRAPGQPAGTQVAEEAQPAGAVLGGGDLQTEDFSVPVGVDGGGEQASGEQRNEIHR